ncbi:hypothetical protein SH449x_000198 [Pirellulaceae bacterium SH449]
MKDSGTLEKANAITDRQSEKTPWKDKDFEKCPDWYGLKCLFEFLSYAAFQIGGTEMLAYPQDLREQVTDDLVLGIGQTKLLRIGVFPLNKYDDVSKAFK